MMVGSHVHDMVHTDHGIRRIPNFWGKMPMTTKDDSTNIRDSSGEARQVGKLRLDDDAEQRGRELSESRWSKALDANQKARIRNTQLANKRRLDDASGEQADSELGTGDEDMILEYPTAKKIVNERNCRKGALVNDSRIQDWRLSSC